VYVRLCVYAMRVYKEKFLITFHLIFIFLAFEREMAQHEHDYLISYKHNLSYVYQEPKEGKNGKMWQSRVEFIILINVENVSDVQRIRE
jgi:hypothetical protein